VKRFRWSSKRTAMKPWAVVLCLIGTNIFHRGENGQNWTPDPRSCNVGACQPLPNGRWNRSSSSHEILSGDVNMSRVTQHSVPRVRHKILSGDVNMSHVTQHSAPRVRHKILSGDLNMSHVTQHSAPRVLTQDQRDDRMSICGDLIGSGQQRLFWGRMWICLSVCEYLVMWGDKTTVHEIIDCIYIHIR
jgi:hypothetical protein